MADSIFILGRQPELSAAELTRVCSSIGAQCAAHNRFALRCSGLADPQRFFASLGGSVKLGEELFTVPRGTLDSTATLQRFLNVIARPGKTVFGFSMYGFVNGKPDILSIAKKLKRLCAARKQSCRYVQGTDGALSSVVVQKSGMLGRGAEFLLVARGREILVGRTVAVQQFEEFSARDYGRPGRNARSGMLPPKLARMLINLSGAPKDGVLLDPFCGSGTVLTEAMTLGFAHLIGSDSLPRAVAETKKNIVWFRSRRGSDMAEPQIFVADIRSLAARMPQRSVDAIVTEPFLGPPLSGNERSRDIREQQQELVALYRDAFRVFGELVRSGGVVVFLLPVFFQLHQPQFLPMLDDFLAQGFRQVPPLPSHLAPLYAQDLTFRHTLLYHRPGQRIGREVLLLQKT